MDVASIERHEKTKKGKTHEKRASLQTEVRREVNGREEGKRNLVDEVLR